MERMAKNDICWIGLFISLFTIMRIIKFIPPISPSLYYTIWGGVIFVLFSIKGNKNYKFNTKMVLFIVCCLLSILLNDIDIKYNVELRFIGFLLIVLCVGPVINASNLNSVKVYCFKYTSIILVVVSIVSIVLYWINPNMMLTERGNLFGGITIHSMQMGPIAGLSTSYMIYRLLTLPKGTKMYLKVLYCILLILSCIACILAGSRSALLAMLLAILAFLYLFYQDKKIIFLRIFLLSILFIISTSRYWWEYTETIRYKMELAEDKGDLFSSRASTWDSRIAEFYDNPIFGCGFATVIGDYSSRGENGIVEPGNGWLFVLSSTGIISFILFLTIYLGLLYSLYHIGTHYSILLITQLIYVGVHLNAEGYTLSSGIFLFYYLWNLLGCSYSYVCDNNRKKYRMINK